MQSCLGSASQEAQLSTAAATELPELTLETIALIGLYLFQRRSVGVRKVTLRYFQVWHLETVSTASPY